MYFGLLLFIDSRFLMFDFAAFINCSQKPWKYPLNHPACGQCGADEDINTFHLGNIAHRLHLLVQLGDNADEGRDSHCGSILH